ncbi:Calmodulin [Acropora cervicornis]|uniref:Calmodulin n=1 Tax=Acropora cervicornis TaxID=6130 RepID=A0AAD9Q5C5_ACRCE|nr:Calmodulin [Acropora cervicornis]
MKKRQRKLISVRRVFDADNKGFIYTADLRFIILNMDCSIPRDELNELIMSTNLNQDRKISLQEFLSLLMPVKEK